MVINRAMGVSGVGARHFIIMLPATDTRDVRKASTTARADKPPEVACDRDSRRPEVASTLQHEHCCCGEPRDECEPVAPQ